MSTSSSSPDKFQREIDDIIRLAEKRLEHESPGYRARRTARRVEGMVGRFSFHLPRPEVLGGWGLALLLLSWLLGLLRFGALMGTLMFAAQVVGITLLLAAIVTSLLKDGSSGGAKTWRGERITYGNPYRGNGFGLVQRLRRMFKG